MKNIINLMILVMCCASVAAIAGADEDQIKVTAKAVIMGTEADSLVRGLVTFVEKEDGLDMIATLSNVTPAGKHGIHIHAGGSCGDGGEAAGGHFNPAMAPHGFLVQDGYEKAHAGDLGNIEIDKNGQGLLVLFIQGLSLSRESNNIVGHAIILHEKEDDFGQPTGNARGRIGCGTINLSN